MKRSRSTAVTIGAVAVFAGATSAAHAPDDTQARFSADTIGAVTLLAEPTTADHAPNLPKDQIDALSGIDVVITQPLIEDAFDLDPVDELVALAQDPDEDPGVRLRAYRALSLYPDAAPVLAADIDEEGQLGTGLEALLLRAQIEALGEIERTVGPAHYDVLLDHLYHRERDVRAATADALRVMRATGAIDALYVRLSVEDSQQVALAITRALRDLSALIP